MMLPSKKTPTWLIERVAQDELATGEVEQIRERLFAEGRSLEGELGAISASNRDILAELPREAMGAAIRNRAARVAAPTARSRLVLFALPAALAGVAALAVFLVRSDGGKALAPGLPSSGVEEIGIKGDVLPSPRLLVYRQRSGKSAALGGPERLSDGARAARGDLLQLAYDKAPEGLYGVLLSIDGAGRVTEHLPEEGARASAPLTSVRETPLPSAYELDDAPDFERFVLVTSPQPFAVALALDAARALASHGPAAKNLPLALGPGFGQTSFLLHKIGKGVP